MIRTEREIDMKIYGVEETRYDQFTGSGGETHTELFYLKRSDALEHGRRLVRAGGMVELSHGLYAKNEHGQYVCYASVGEQRENGKYDVEIIIRESDVASSIDDGRSILEQRRRELAEQLPCLFGGS